MGDVSIWYPPSESRTSSQPKLSSPKCRLALGTSPPGALRQCVGAASRSQVKLCQVGCKSQPLRLDYTGCAAPGPGNYLAVNAFISLGHPPCKRGIRISWSRSLRCIQVWGRGAKSLWLTSDAICSSGQTKKSTVFCNYQFCGRFAP